jgi:hypothetical protein
MSTVDLRRPSTYQIMLQLIFPTGAETQCDDDRLG